MKITEFLKKYSLIDSKFIDDFYTFYDDGYNEYEFVINLETISNWLNMDVNNLKRLLKDHFIENEDFIITQNELNSVKHGGQNKHTVLLTYSCCKMLCMLSKTKKANEIRRFYIELEKLIIKYKDNIVNDLNQQLGIKTENKNIINENKQKGLIYILNIDDKIINSDDEKFTSKIGKTNNIDNRMNQYNVGKINQNQIALVYLTEDIGEIEKCLKRCFSNKQIKNKTELYNLTLSEVKETINYCNKIKTSTLLKNSKMLKNDKIYLIMIEKSSDEDINNKIKLYKKDIQKHKNTTKKSNSKKSNSNKSNSKKSNNIL